MVFPGRSRFLSGTGSPGSVRRAFLNADGEATDAFEDVPNPDYDPNDPDSSPTIRRNAGSNPDAGLHRCRRRNR